MTFASNLPISGQRNFNRYMPNGLPGMMSGMGSAQIYPHMNTLGTLDTFTVTPPATVDNSSVYSVSVNGVTVSFTTDANATTAELGTGLYNLMRQDPEFYSLVEVTINTSTSVITLVSRAVGTTLTVVADPAALTNVITVAKTVSTSSNLIIPFGRFVGRLSSYARDQRQNVSTATLVNAASGFELLGVTLSSHATEKVGRFGQAQDGYAFGTTMNVVKNTGTYKGVYVECVEPNLVIGDSARIAVGAGNEGKLTKETSGTINVSTSVIIVSATEVVFGRNIVLAEVKL